MPRVRSLRETGARHTSPKVQFRVLQGNRAFPNVLQLRKNNQSQMILGELTGGLYFRWVETIGCGMGFGDKYILFAEAKMSVMLYLHGEEIQVLCFVIDYL